MIYNTRKELAVALRKESVDRNNLFLAICHMEPGSLSARRAWIEIMFLRAARLPVLVALRKESVDRNYGNRYRP